MGSNGPDDSEYQVGLATAEDITAILELQEHNLPERGGTLSVRFSFAWFEAAIGAMPVLVARRANDVVGYLVSSSKAVFAGSAMVKAMLDAYPGDPDAYLYGPICVHQSARGQGVAGKMFAALQACLPGREGILFIRRDNNPSIRAHLKMGMREVAAFEFNGTEFAVFSFVG